MEFKHTTDYEWKKIEGEKYRTYVFPNGSRVKIKKPLYLNVSKSGGHRIFDAQGFSHYIPYKWIHLFWEVEGDDRANFRF